jgi:hypothetical protein
MDRIESAAARDETHDANIAQRESIDEAKHGGHLTKSEQINLLSFGLFYVKGDAYGSSFSGHPIEAFHNVNTAVLTLWRRY